MIVPGEEIVTTTIAEKKTMGRGRVYSPHAASHAESLAGLPLASFGARAGAFLVDLVIILVAYLPITFLIKWVAVGRKAKSKIDINWDFHEPSNIVFILLYFGLTLYFGKGYTVGKRLFRIRVVSLVHARITLWQSIERALGYGASMLEAGFGFIQYFTHPNRCCVHDRIAETIVVKARSGKPAPVPKQVAGEALKDPSPAIARQEPRQL